MLQLTHCNVLLALVVHSAITATVDLVNIPGDGEIAADTQCPAQESRGAAIQNIRASVDTITQNLISVSHNCGSGLWYCVYSSSQYEQLLTAVSISLEGVQQPWNEGVQKTNGLFS